MFDFGFSELVVIGVVALVVLGPERLPVVARTAGEWIGKAQRLVQQVKSDIEQEAELSELKKIQQQAQGIADDIKNTVKGQTDAIEKEIESVKSDVDKAESEIAGSVDSLATDSVKDADALSGTNVVEEGATGEATPDPAEDFYGWYGAETEESDDGTVKTFEKRYRAGPSIDELAEEIERLKRELGERTPQFGGNNRRLAARARSNRPRIYR